MSSPTEGIVLRAISGVYTVQCERSDALDGQAGHVVHCTLRGNLKKEFRYSTSASFAKRVTRAKRPHTTDTISVGDRVRFVESRQGSGVIEEIMPRRSRFTRSGFRGREQTVVCNLDQLFVVFACAEPRPDPWKVDRFLAAIESEELPAIILANKADIVGETGHAEVFDEWQRVGYRVLATSATANTGIDLLREELKGKVSAFVGPSGVGKSSLLNAVQPGLRLRTAEIGYVTFKGKHTTTATQLIPLLSGGWVADTPGLRQLDLIAMDREELLECFPEFRGLQGRCRFDDCRHDKEPDCAIKKAVESEGASRRRYESFLALATEAEAKRRVP